MLQLAIAFEQLYQDQYRSVLGAYHGFDQWLQPGAYSSDWTVRCRCGWRVTISDLELSSRLGMERMVEHMWRLLDRHFQTALDELSPSLSELSDWGWFQPEDA